MRRALLALSIIIYFFLPEAWGQTQTVNNGASTAAVNFPGTACVYNWVNDTPGIGLPAGGTGDIGSFTAINNGNAPVIATITATPQTGGIAYVPNYNDGTVSVVNMINNTVMNITVGTNPVGSAVSADGTRAYIANQGSDDVSVINTATNTVTATIPLGVSPYSLAVSPDGSRLYVTESISNTVSIINAVTNTVISKIFVNTNALGVVVSPDGKWVYVGNYGSNNISVINTATNTDVAGIALSRSGPSGLAISPDGKWLYVVDELNDGVSVINTTTRTETAAIAVGQAPFGAALSPDGSRLYVCNTLSNSLTVINTATAAIITTIAVGDGPFGASVSPDGSMVFVANSKSNTVSVVGTANNTLLNTVNVGSLPYSVGGFAGAGPVCSPVTFIITVDPTPVSVPLITTGAVTGTISACAGSPAVSPQVQQFTVSGANLTSNIKATAPNNFEISLSPGSGFGSSLTLSQTAGVVKSTVVYVRSSAASATGNISGNVTLTSPGAQSPKVPVRGIISASPTISLVSNQTFVAGQITTGVHFNGAANTYNWVNNTPGIGLPASGTGDIAPFTAVNNGSGRVTATITVTPQNSGFAYIPNNIDGTVTLINTATNTVAGKITVGADPLAVAISPDGSKVFVTNNGDNTVSVIDTKTNSLLTSFFNGASPNSIAITPDGSTIYVSNYGSNTVSVIDGTYYQLKTDVIVGSGSFGIVVSPDGGRVYVANQGSNTVSVISTATNTVIGTIPVGSAPRGVAVSPDGSTLYVTNSGSNTVSVINTATYAITPAITVGSNPSNVVLSANGSVMYVSNSGSATVSVINTATDTVTATVVVGSGPQGISLSPDGNELYVANQNSNDVSVISTSANQVIATVAAGTSPIAFGNFVSAGTSCTGAPTQFTITITPTSNTPSTITASTATGIISACAGTASQSPNFEHFVVSGSNLTGDITATAPANFEISLSASGGFGNTLTLAQTGGTVSGVKIYVRSLLSAPAGSISGNVTLTSAGAAPQNVVVNGIAAALPTVNIISNQSIFNGFPTTAVNFTGTSRAFYWTNDTPGIGLAAGGVGNIPSFTGINTGGTPITATITVTPVPGGFAYIANRQSNSVSVINIATNAIAAVIPVGTSPWGVSVTPDGSRVYVTNQGSNNVSVINTSNNTVTATIPVGLIPDGVALTPDGSTAYVANNGSNTVSVINTATLQVTTINVGLNPTGVVMSPDGSTVYVGNETSDNISVINTATNLVTVTIPLTTGCLGLAISPEGTVLYVADQTSANVTVINTTNNTITAVIPVLQVPAGIAVSADGSRVYVADSGSNEVSVISTVTNQVIATIPFASEPFGISVTPDGTRVFVTNITSDRVSVVSPATNTIVSDILVGSSPNSLGNFISQTSICPGEPMKFTITVKPTNPTITAGAKSGRISACAGNASVSPEIEQFTVSGSDLTADVTATAPANFEISLKAGSGYGNSVTITQTGGTVTNIVVYVRSSASAPSGSISGNVTLSSAGISNPQVAVTGYINALPVINPVANQNPTNGTTTQAVDFTGTATKISWINNTPGIGLAAGGTGNIAPFVAVNKGKNPVTATITATPTSIAYAYIADAASNSVLVINVATGVIVSTVAVGNYPCGVAVSPDGSQVNVTNQKSNTISVISTATNTVTATITTADFGPTAAAVSPDGQHLYVVNLNSNNISVFNTINNNLIATIGVGGNPVGVAVTPDGSKVYVTNSSNAISVIDAESNTVKTTITEGNSPYGMAITPDGSKVYAAISGADDVSVISTATDAIIATIPVGTNPAGVTISPDGSTVYVSNQLSNNVSVISAGSNTVTSTIQVGTNPAGMSMTADGSELYAVNEKSGDISVINTRTNLVASTVKVGQSPVSLGNFISAGAGCSGIPVSFTITVNPTVIPAINTAGTLSPLVTTYGTPSVSTSFTVSGTALTVGILVTPPPGFEVSTDNISFTATVTVGAGGNIPSTPVYIRLAAITPVGSYTGNIALGSTPLPGVNIVMPLSTVNPAPLTVTADDKSKAVGTPNPVLTASYIGFVNSETFVSLTTQPVLSTTAVTASAIGAYPITVTGGSSPNYTITLINGTLTVIPTEKSLFIPNTFTPNGDGINDTWDIKYLNYYVNCSVDIFTRWGQKVYSSIGYPIPWDGTYRGTGLPVGTYYYVINLKNGDKALAGFVALIR